MDDISNRDDLEMLMAEFYNKLLDDPTIGYIFTDVAKIDLATHLPHIVDFWDQSLFNSAVYRNNVLQVHMDLDNQENLTSKHFETWYSHFEQTIDEHFAGPKAETAKTRALSIATIMQIKLAART